MDVVLLKVTGHATNNKNKKLCIIYLPIYLFIYISTIYICIYVYI